MEEEKQLTQDESLRLITDMITKAKSHFHESGTSAILWGSVVGVAGLLDFAQSYWHFSIGFDIWYLVLAAIIPQIIISIRENRNKKVVTHTEAVLDAVWLVYGISLFALIFYLNAVPNTTDKLLSNENIALVQTNADGSKAFLHSFVPSHTSLFLLIYAIPTLITGIACKFRPMLWGALLCYVFFIISCFTENAYDLLFNGLAGIFNWLIPGIILRRTFYRRQKAMNV